jgi:hypothetical protein
MFDFKCTASYDVAMKQGTTRRRKASPADVVRLARQVHWRDAKLSTGETVTAETTRELFEDAARALKSKSRRKRIHAAVA